MPELITATICFVLSFAILHDGINRENISWHIAGIVLSFMWAFIGMRFVLIKFLKG